MSLAQYQPAINRPRRVKPGQVWHARLPGHHTLACVVIDEVTPNTVVLRLEAELVAIGNTAPAVRYARDEVRFVEKLP